MSNYVKYIQFIISVSSMSINRFAINELTGNVATNFSKLFLVSKIAVCTFSKSTDIHLKKLTFYLTHKCALNKCS